jgi:hypothetical protein
VTDLRPCIGCSNPVEVDPLYKGKTQSAFFCPPVRCGFFIVTQMSLEAWRKRRTDQEAGLLHMALLGEAHPDRDIPLDFDGLKRLVFEQRMRCGSTSLSFIQVPANKNMKARKTAERLRYLIGGPHAFKSAISILEPQDGSYWVVKVKMGDAAWEEKFDDQDPEAIVAHFRKLMRK